MLDLWQTESARVGSPQVNLNSTMALTIHQLFCYNRESGGASAQRLGKRTLCLKTQGCEINTYAMWRRRRRFMLRSNEKILPVTTKAPRHCGSLQQAQSKVAVAAVLRQKSLRQTGGSTSIISGQPNPRRAGFSTVRIRRPALVRICEHGLEQELAAVVEGRAGQEEGPRWAQFIGKKLQLQARGRLGMGGVLGEGGVCEGLLVMGIAMQVLATWEDGQAREAASSSNNNTKREAELHLAASSNWYLFWLRTMWRHQQRKLPLSMPLPLYTSASSF
jgi:hypothetical protein